MGISVVTWTLGMTAAQDVTSRAIELGLEGIQYAGDHRDVDPLELKSRAEQSGLRIIAVDPVNAAPEDPQAATEAGAIAYYRDVVDFAAALGSVPVTLHGLSLWTSNCADKGAARERLVRCCRAVDSYARTQGVRTLYEVCNHYEVPLIHTAFEFRELVREVGGSNMGLILDSFHMNIDEPDPSQALRDNLDILAIYHISDSGRGGIGSGHIDFRAQHDILVRGGFEGDIAVEPVLARLTPSTPPGNGAEHAALDEEIRRSVTCWQAYSAG